MKGEYVDDQDDTTHQNHHQDPNTCSTTTSTQNVHNNNTTMFATTTTTTHNNNTNTKFPHHPKFLSPPPHFLPPPPQQQHPYHHQQQQQQQQYLDEQHPPQQQRQRCEEAESGARITSNTPSKKPKTLAITTTSSEDGGTIEVGRRPRGRPPGSKNKPKPPIIITRESEPAMSPYILELPGGADMVDSLTRFTRRRGVGLCVLTASGAVANVSLKQPSTSTPGGTVTFHGRFDILSLSACLINTVPFNNGGFTISLAGPQGQIVGGKVVGPLVCATTVYVVAASFNNPSYCRLPLEEHQQQEVVQNTANVNVNVTGGADGQSDSPVSGGGDGGANGGDGGVSGPMSLYSVHMGNPSAGGDVVWAPTARPPY